MMNWLPLKPRQLRVEASSFCQLKCPSCPTGRGENKSSHIGAGFLKKDQFEKMLQQSLWIERVELSNWGEIFLNKEIGEIFRIAHQRGVRIHASNGVNLNTCAEEALEACVRYQVEHLTCSIDGASQETYSKYRRSGHYETVVANIRKINFYKKKYHSPWPRLTWQFVIFGHNEHEISKARKLAEELGMTFRPKLSWDEKFSPIKDPERVQRETGLKSTSRSEFINQTKTNYVRSICMQLWSEPQINFDGKVLGCCVNTWGDFGNAFEEELGPVLNNRKLKYARRMLMGLVGPREDIPCTRCSKYKDMEKHQMWISAQEVKAALDLHPVHRALRFLGWYRLGRRFEKWWSSM